MSFQLKDFVSIAASMLNYARATQDKVTDFSVGGVARTLMEAPAIEIEELYQRIFAGIMEAIPVAIYRGFNFSLQEAVAASGTVRVTFGVPLEEAVEIPAGTIFAAPSTGVKYLSNVAVIAPVGATSVEVDVTCTQAGTIGNIGADSITEAQNFDLPTGATIGNDPISSGHEQETEDERKARFADFIRSISRGTLESVLFAASIATVKSSSGMTVEFVSRVGHVEEAGHIDVYIYGSGGAPSDALVLAAQKLIDGYYEADGTPVPGYRAGGIRVRVLKMAERSIDVTMNVGMFSGYALNSAIRAQIRNQLDTEFDRVGSGSILYMKRLTDAVLTVLGVKEAFSSNDANIQCGANEVLRLGNLTVSDINA